MKKKKYLKRSLPTNFKSADQFNEPGGTFITLGKNKIKNNLNDYNNYSVENRWWKKILTKGKNILVIIFESQSKHIEDTEFEYEIDITRDDISGLEIDISGIIIDPDEVDISYQVVYDRIEENIIVSSQNAGEIICSGPCKCTARTINKCKIVKDLKLVNEKSISRAERLHQNLNNSRKGKSLLEKWTIDKQGRRSHLISYNSVCPQPEPQP